MWKMTKTKHTTPRLPTIPPGTVSVGHSTSHNITNNVIGDATLKVEQYIKTSKARNNYTNCITAHLDHGGKNQGQ